MVKIYGESGASFSSMAAYVSLEDYESLKAALREALEAWEWWIGARQGATPGPDFAIKRIAELRKFLDDK